MHRTLTCLSLIGLAACGPAPHQADATLRACAAAGGAVTSIATAVTRLNALPTPVDAPCFVASLPRPISVVSTTGVTSAQPAVGKENPRVFLLLPGVAVSVVAAGDGAKLLEFGEWVTPTRTLKGELELPVTAPLAAEAPFERVLFGSPATSCGLCHREEAPHDPVPGGYVSVAFKPQPGSFVTLSALTAQHDACVAADDETGRCQLFHALFDFGEVKDGAFAAEVTTFTP